jgi:hypothetical protein
MSTISTTITHNITFGTSGAYTSPLSITSTGAVLASTSGNEAVYDAGIGVLTNQGSIVGSNGRLGVELPSGGSVTNSGVISGVYTGILLGAAASVTNSGTIISTNDTNNFLAFRYDVGFSADGSLTNAGSGTITGGVGFINAPGTVTNAGAIGNDDGVGVALDYGGTLTDSGSISASDGNSAVYFGGQFFQTYFHGTAATVLLNLESGWSITGSVVGNDISGSTNLLELTGSSAAPVVVNFSPTSFTNFGTVEFAPGASNFATLGLATTLDVPGTIANFSGPHDVVDLAFVSDVNHDATVVPDLATGQLTITGDDGTSAVLQLDTAENYSGLTFGATPDASGTGTDIGLLCFCRGTHLATPAGEVPVERLAIGDTVLTSRGVARTIVWIGEGQVLATRGRRNAATPIVVCKGALADNVPHRDLRVTKGHSFHIDGVLIPVEFLVNHRSIRWDDHAQEVHLYHVELDSHDVLLANGAPAESYRDDGNRWLFRNANSGWDRPTIRPCAPVLTGGPIVDAAWRRLLDRSGPAPVVPLTDDPDLHLRVDGRRVDASARSDRQFMFRLAGRPAKVSIVSRTGVPQELRLARDPRTLGVALRQVIVTQGPRLTLIEAEDARLTQGFHAFEADQSIRWTSGDAALPDWLFEGLSGPFEVTLRLGGSTCYLDDGPAGVRAA